MATFTREFSGDAVGTLPSDFTIVSGSKPVAISDIEGDKSLRFSGSGTNDTIVIHTPVGTGHTDIEIAAIGNITDTQVTSVWELALRYNSGNGGTWYRFDIDPLGGSSALRVRRMWDSSASTGAFNATAAAPTIPAGTRFAYRARTSGPALGDVSLQAKIWIPTDPTNPGASEPASWMLSATDPNGVPAGSAGVQSSRNVSNFFYLGFSNAGETAPLTVGGGGDPPPPTGGAISGTLQLSGGGNATSGTMFAARNGVVVSTSVGSNGAFTFTGLVENAEYDVYGKTTVGGSVHTTQTLVRFANPIVGAPTFTITTSVSPLAVGATRQLTWNVSGSPTPTVTFGSNNTGIATVTNGGLITAVAEGSATITGTATNSNGVATSTYALSVVAAGSGTFRNFSTEPVGALPSGFTRLSGTRLWTTANAVGGVTYLTVDGGTGVSALAWTEMGIHAEAELFSEVEYTGTNTSRLEWGLRISENGLDYYRIDYDHTNLRLRRMLNGSPTGGTLTTIGVPIASGTRLRARHRIESPAGGGAIIKSKLWNAAQAEPSEWNIEHIESSSNALAAGRVGLVSGGEQPRYYRVGMASGGGTAPSS